MIQMARVTSNRFPLKYEAALDQLYDYFMDMDLEDMVDELSITKEEILDRFKDKVYTYNQHIDGEIEDVYEEQYLEDEVDHHLHTTDTLDDILEDMEKGE